MAKDARQSVGHIVSHTHWDREWRWPVWTTRLQLIEFFKQLLELMERREDFRYYTLDGQSVMVTDYLEMAPEDRARIVRLVTAGRLFIGPWFTLPDPWPIAGECLVRNLLVGRKVCRELGGALSVGYTTFGWGQPAQIPQLYAGFGIEAIVTAKNVSRQRAPHSEFLWRSPDGTTVFTTRLGELGRANFYKRALLKILHGGQFWSDEWHFDWRRAGLIVRSADAGDQAMDFHHVDSGPRIHAEHLRDALLNAWSTTEDSLSPTDRFLGEGCDYTVGLELLPELIEQANAAFDDRQFIHGNLPDYIQRLRGTIPLDVLRVVEGELRDPPITAVQGNALATRLYLKRLNRLAEHALIQGAEPLVAIARMMGLPCPAGFLENAWRYLLLSHSHDAINGVTLDKISRDVVHRLEQVLEIAHALTIHAMTGMIGRMNLSGFDAGDVLLVVFNPLPMARREVLFAALDTPREQDVARFSLVDTDGRRRPVQWIDRHEHLVPVHDACARPRPFYCDRHTVYFDTGEVPAGGYKVYRLVAESRQDRSLDFLYERIDQGSQLCDGGMGMENEFLKVTFQSDGTFDLLDKTTNRAFRGLNAYEDGGELGDYWHRTVPNHDEVISSRGFPHRIRLVRDGPLVTTFAIETTMRVPARADWSRRARGADCIDLRIETEVSLAAGQRRVDVTVRFNNQAEDHRLRALIPTWIQAEHSDAEGHFLVLRRPITLARDVNGVGPGGMKTLPQHTFVDLSDGEGGLAILNRGLTEFEVSEDASRTIALTLLRTAPMKICTEFRTPTVDPNQKGGQCLGEHVCEYSLYPHTGDWSQGGVNREAQFYTVPLRSLQTAPHARGRHAPTRSFYELKSDRVVAAAMKTPDDAQSGWDLVLRIYNPSPAADRAEWTFNQPLARAALLQLNEEEIAPLEVTDQRKVGLEVGPGKIVTVGIAFRESEP